MLYSQTALAFCFFAPAIFAPAIFAATSTKQNAVHPPKRAELPRAAALFIKNEGQAEPDVLWQAKGASFEASFSRDSFVFHIFGPKPKAGQDTPAGAVSANTGIAAERLDREQRLITEQRISLAGANPGASLEPLDPQPGTVNFFRGSDPKRWIHGLATYARLRYQNIYPGIDLLFYPNQGTLEYDFVVSPGTDPSAIRLRVEDGQPARITEQGELQVGEGTQAVLHRPMLYQNRTGGKRAIEGRFVSLTDGAIGFQFGAYDRSQTLVVDPTLSLLYSTYLGGIHNDTAAAMTLDAQNNTYIAGQSASQDYPVTGNAYQTQRKMIGVYVYNAVVTKISPSGTLLFSTFIGGSTGDDATGIALDAQGNAYIVGTTKSTDYPVTANAYQSTYPQGAANSAFISELSPDGSALLYSSFFAGSGGSGAGEGQSVVLSQGNLYFTGGAGPGLPTTAGAYMTQIDSGGATFVAEFDLTRAGAAQLVASSYYGATTPAANSEGTGNSPFSMVLDSAGNPWITGTTYTNNLPTTANALQKTLPPLSPTCRGGGANLNSAAYLAKLSADLKTLIYASYLSGQTTGRQVGVCSEFSRSITLDGSGNLYLAGSTASATFPVTAGVVQGSYPGSSGYVGFVSKLSPDGTTLLWSSYLGGNAGYTFPAQLVFDGQGNPWIGGTTQGGTNFPISAGAYQTAEKGSYNGTLTEFSPDGTEVLYSTYLGGSGNDSVQGLAFDGGGNVYVTGDTTSTDFPVSANAFQSQWANGQAGDGNDIFFTILGTGAIGAISPTTGGNTGDTSVTISGSGFQQGGTCALVMGTTTIQAASVAVSSSGTSLTCTFALNGATPGSYALSVTNASGGTFVKPAAFTVTGGGIGPQVWVNIAGRSTLRIGVPETFFITYGNTGDTNALFSTIFIQTPSAFQFSYTAVHPSPLPGGDVDFSQIPQTTLVNGQNTAAVVIPLLAPGATASFALQIAASDDPDDFTIVAYTTTAPLATSLAGLESSSAPQIVGAMGFADELGLHPHASTAGACIQDVVGAVFSALPGVSAAGCAGAALGSIVGSIVQGFSNPSAPVNFADVAGQLAASAGPACLNAALGSNPATAWIAAIGALYNGYQAYQDCQKYLKPLLPKLMKLVQPKKANDPNEKAGPSGDNSPSQYVNVSQPLSYIVTFENQVTATLPAAQVVVTDQLGPTKVDLTTLAFGAITFGTNVITLPSGVDNYSTTYALNSSLSVRIQGSLNSDTGLLKWTFTSIDPATGLPPSDPTVGFLPPDVDGIEGQGAVVFSVMPKNAPTGTQITNMATVVFDKNPPINTATWLNTLDVTPPISKVQALPATEMQATFPVSWLGTDVGSGIAAYTIYVSDNGGPYTVWQSSVTTTSAYYTGLPGHTYAFYSIATDGAGNVEASKSAPDTSTQMGGTLGGPALIVSKSHSGNFAPGEQGATYQVSVSNSAGAAASSGMVKVTETLPAGLTLVSMAGTKWSCPSNTCTRNDSLTGGASYPPITVTVNVAASAASSVTNTVAVSGGGSLTSASYDVTTIAVEAAPFGSFDTPTNGQTGLAGDVNFGGWALSTIPVSVQIWRNPVPHEATQANGLVFVGDTTFVSGTRPDIASAYPGYPNSNAAGWGAQVLTNELPNSAGSGTIGNGTYTFHALAIDATGLVTDLGAHMVTVNNAASVLPFGSIDTPAAGATISGTAYVNFGWALTPQPNSINTNGSTINVFIDAKPVGHPVYNNPRSDIETLFPGYANTNGAIGYLRINTTTLPNGLHQISWGVTDSAGHRNGIGSRYFIVQN